MPNNPPAGTPNALEEARQALADGIVHAIGCVLTNEDSDAVGVKVENATDALIAAVRAEADQRHGDVMSESWEAGRAYGHHEGRTATLAEVRRVVEEMRLLTEADTIWRDGWDRCAERVLAALDTLEGK